MGGRFRGKGSAMVFVRSGGYLCLLARGVRGCVDSIGDGYWGGGVERGQRALCLTLESMKCHQLSPFVQYVGLISPILCVQTNLGRRIIDMQFYLE